MTAPENSHDINKDNSNAALEALGNAARAYASLAPNLAASGAFPPLGVDASALLMNPAAAVAAVAAAAAKHFAAQGQGHTTTPAPPAITATPSTLAATFGHPHNPSQAQPTPSPAAALAAASALLPNAATAFQGHAALHHVSALLQSMGQQVSQAQSFAAANTPSPAAPTPPPTYSPPPPPPPAYPQQQQRSVSEPTTTTQSQNSFSTAAQVVAAHAATPSTMPSSALLPNIQNWSMEQLGKLFLFAFAESAFGC